MDDGSVDLGAPMARRRRASSLKFSTQPPPPSCARPQSNERSCTLSNTSNTTTFSESVGESVAKQESYIKQLTSIINGHDCGDVWRFGKDLIRDTYEADYKLPALHARVLEEYEKSKNTLPLLRTMRDKERLLSDMSSSIVSKESHMSNSEILERRIEDLETDSTKKEFTQLVQPLVQEYSSLGTTRRMISF